MYRVLGVIVGGNSIAHQSRGRITAERTEKKLRKTENYFTVSERTFFGRKSHERGRDGHNSNFDIFFFQSIFSVCHSKMM